MSQKQRMLLMRDPKFSRIADATCSKISLFILPVMLKLRDYCVLHLLNIKNSALPSQDECVCLM